MTNKELINDRIRENKYRPKLTEKQKQEIIELYHKPVEEGKRPTYKELAMVYGCSDVSIFKVINKYRREVLENE
jgi:transposase-like protein